MSGVDPAQCCVAGCADPWVARFVVYPPDGPPTWLETCAEHKRSYDESKGAGAFVRFVASLGEPSRKCRWCKWWNRRPRMVAGGLLVEWRVVPFQGECRRNPPSVGWEPGAIGARKIMGWPETSSLQWCGEWEVRT